MSMSMYGWLEPPIHVQRPRARELGPDWLPDSRPLRRRFIRSAVLCPRHITWTHLRATLTLARLDNEPERHYPHYHQAHPIRSSV
jgi:hypothetical protein